MYEKKSSKKNEIIENLKADLNNSRYYECIKQIFNTFINMSLILYYLINDIDYL